MLIFGLKFKCLNFQIFNYLKYHFFCFCYFLLLKLEAWSLGYFSTYLSSVTGRVFPAGLLQLSLHCNELRKCLMVYLLWIQMVQFSCCINRYWWMLTGLSKLCNCPGQNIYTLIFLKSVIFGKVYIDLSKF